MKSKSSRRRSGAEGSSLKSTRKTKKPNLAVNVCWEEYPDFDVDATSNSSIYDGWSPDSPCYPELVASQEEIERQNTESALIALAYYNKKHRTNYKLVEGLWSNAYLTNALWIHCGFKAKPDIPSNGESDVEVSPKLFFGEVCESEPFIWKATACRVLDGAKTKSGCLSCKKGEHPTHGFKSGLREYIPRTLRPRSGKVGWAAL